jgi:MFS family permease
MMPSRSVVVADLVAFGDFDRTIRTVMSQTRGMHEARHRNPIRALIVTCGLVGACLAAGYGVLFAMLDDIRDEYGISESALGVVIGIGFFAGFLAQVVIAPYADKGHARRLVLTGMVLNVVGLTMMAVSSTIVPLLAGRFVAGIGIGMAVPALRRIVILADPANLGHNLGVLLAADVAGFAAGPAVAAALVGPFGIAAPFLVMAAATSVAAPFVARTRVAETVEPTSQRFAFDLLRIRPFAGAVVLGCAVFLMIGSFDALWSVALDDLDTSEWISSLGITMFALPLVIFGAAGGRLAQRIGPFRVGTVGLLLGAAFMLMYGLVPTGGAMFAVAMVHAVSDGLTVSSTGVAVGLVVPGERQAGAQGVLGGLQTLTAGAVAILTGVIYDHAGRTAAYSVAAALMVVFISAGAWLAREAWPLKGETEPGGGASEVPGLPAGVSAD